MSSIYLIPNYVLQMPKTTAFYSVILLSAKNRRSALAHFGGDCPAERRNNAEIRSSQIEIEIALFPSNDCDSD